MALKATEWDSANRVAVEVHANGRARAAVIIWAGSQQDPQLVTSDEFNLVSADARERFVSERVTEVQRRAVLTLLETLAVRVAQARGTTSEREETTAAGRAVPFETVEPAEEEADGSQLLETLGVTVLRYVALPGWTAHAIALWVMHTYCLLSAQVSPILAILSPEKRCGKSTLLALLGALVPRPLPAVNVTASAIFRAVEQFSPTLLIDEADTFLTSREEGGDLRGILNSSHTRSGAFVVRTVPTGDAFEVRAFSTWCAKAIALIGDLPDTLRDRSIPVMMRRRSPDEQIERLRLDRLSHLQVIRCQAARWAADNMSSLMAADPEVPSELNDRAADNWRPLLAIADVIGRGWEKRARQAALVLSGIEAQEVASPRELLLADLRQIFAERAADRMPTQSILNALLEREDRPWVEWRDGKPLTARGLARLLKPFGVSPQTLREGAELFKGYRIADFEVPFSRYLPSPAVTSVTSLPQTQLPIVESVTHSEAVTPQKLSKSLGDNGVTVVTPEQGDAWEPET